MVFGPRKHKSSSLGSRIKHFFTDTIGKPLRHAFRYVSDGVSSVYHSITNTASSVVKTLHDDAASLVKGANANYNNVVKGVSNLVVHTEDSLTGVVKVVSHDVKDLGSNVASDISNMAMPLAIAAVAIGGAYYMSQK